MIESGNHAICTVVAKNYLALARTLCDSFLAQHPDGQCFVLFIDEVQGYVDSDKERFEFVSLEEIGLQNLRYMCFKYDVTELATAVKPYLMDYLLAQYSPGKLLYLDPDVLVTDSLTPVFKELDDCDILLTPHLDKDFPNDGLLPDDSHILISGTNNLGFIGLRQCANTQEFLTWWQSKLVDNCVIDHAKGYFVDQKYIDLAVCLFPNINMYGSVTLNVAYWNLHSRRISYAKDRWWVNELPLVFFHFSGYNPLTSDDISRHQNRHRLGDFPDLARLFEHYRDLLIDNDYEGTNAWPYQHGHYSGGDEISYFERKIFRESFAGNFSADPFVRASHSRRFWRKVFRYRLKMKLKTWFSPLFQ